jgi:hypothetical protein
MFNTSRSRAHRAILLVLGLVAACDDSVAPEQPAAPPPAAILSPPASARRFAFLSPLGDGAPENGVFDSTLAPVVEVCRLAPTGACDTAPLLARFERGPGGIRVHEREGRRRDGDEAYYKVEWRPTAGTVDRWRVYRVRVLLGATELGHADVRFSSSDRDRDDDDRRRRSGGSDTTRLKLGRPVPIAFWIERAPQRLTVAVGQGVIGWPHAGDTTYRHGARVFYAFLPAKGYENVEVMLDGDSVPAFGMFTLDTARHLSVTVDRRVTLPPGTEQLFEKARAVLSAADPMAAYQAYLDAVAQYTEGMDPDSAERRLVDMGHLAFDPVRDMDAIIRMDAALAGKSFRFGSPENGAALLAPASASSGLHVEPATFMYVNGVNTLEDETGSTLHRLRLIRGSMPEFSDGRVFVVKGVYNRSFAQPPSVPTSEELRKYCVRAFFSRFHAGILGENAFPRFIAQCSRGASAGVDLVEAFWQVVNIDAGSDQVLADAAVLSERILDEHREGRHAILIPHSQGTLMANQAIHRLREITNAWQPTRDSTCIAAIPLAAPTSERWEELLPRLALLPINVDGDIILSLGRNTWPRISTAYSRSLARPLTRGDQIRLHLVANYLSDRGAAEAFRQGLHSVYGSCVVRTIRFDSVSLTVAQGATRRVNGIPMNAYDQPLFGRRLQFTSSDAAVVGTFATSGTSAIVSGVATGVAQVEARSRDFVGTLPVTVTPRPPETFPSTYRASVPAGWGGDMLSCGENTLRPARTIELRFFIQFGEPRIHVVVTQPHNGSQSSYFSPYIELAGTSPGVDVRGNPTQSFRVRWSADRLTLSGEAEHQILRCPDGTRPLVIDSITFQRVP